MKVETRLQHTVNWSTANLDAEPKIEARRAVTERSNLGMGAEVYGYGHLNTRRKSCGNIPRMGRSGVGWRGLINSVQCEGEGLQVEAGAKYTLPTDNCIFILNIGSSVAHTGLAARQSTFNTWTQYIGMPLCDNVRHGGRSLSSRRPRVLHLAMILNRKEPRDHVQPHFPSLSPVGFRC